MVFETNKYALAVAITMSILYAICTLIVALFPEISGQLAGWLIHITNVGPLQVTPVGAIGGIVQIFIYTYLIGWLFAFTYNRLVGNQK